METEISTHALTEGDRKDMFCSSVCMNFNSRPHGGRLAYWQQFLRREHFNSRPHGGRRAEKNSTWTAYYFNSRPHGGRRRDFCQLLIDLEFQLTPSRRATTHSGRSRSRSCNFNSRPHGGRHCSGAITRRFGTFQLTPSRRATCPLSIFVRRIDFNSRPHGGRHVSIV